MSWLKSSGVPYELCGERFELAFSQNVMEAILDRFGSRAAFLKEFNGTLPKVKKTDGDESDEQEVEKKELTEEEYQQEVAREAAIQRTAAQLYRTVLCILINDAIEEENAHRKDKLEFLTEKKLGRVLRNKDYVEMRNLIVKVWNESNDIEQANDDDEEDIDEGDLPEEPGKN